MFIYILTCTVKLRLIFQNISDFKLHFDQHVIDLQLLASSTAVLEGLMINSAGEISAIIIYICRIHRSIRIRIFKYIHTYMHTNAECEM